MSKKLYPIKPIIRNQNATVITKPRTAELVLVTPNGRPVGRLPAVPVETPWWQDVEPVVRAARDHHGVDVTILRLLDAELEQPHGGRVTYLAEVAEPVSAQPWIGVLDDHPRRQAFARPGGPAADLAWARAKLAERGLRPTAPPTQVRTWNLSSLFGAVRAHWLQQWSEAAPGSDPARASVLLAPVAAARQAVIYRTFLDNIEPSEQPYHRADPAQWLIRTAALVRKSDRPGPADCV
jgi:hypothetical protein